MGPLWLTNIIISLMIVSALLYSLRNYLLTRKLTRTKFTNALVALTVIFILQNLYSAYMFYMLSWSDGSNIAYPLLILNLIAMAGFGIFVYLSKT
jgi:hypothetical protein